MDHQWHYVRNGKSLGPVSTSELRQLVARGELGSDDLVWHDGMTEWSSVDAMNLAPPAVTPPPVPPPRSATPQFKQPTRRRRAPSNQQAVVWSVVGVVAILVCVGWVIMSLPHEPPKPERAPNPRDLVARTNDASEPAKKQRETVAVPRPLEDSVPNVPDPIPFETTPEVNPAPEQPKEMAKPAIESRSPEVPKTTANEPPQAAPATVQSLAATPAKQTLFQVVEIRRVPTFSIQGLETKQSLHYQVLSQLDLERNAESRTTTVVQLVEDTRLVAADDSSREGFAKSLESLKRQQYTYRLNDRGEVIEFTGHKDTRVTIPLDLASATGFQLTSVIDEDGWKELAELTFVVPPDGQRAGEPWKRQMTHDWGALGGWSGVTTFASQPAREQLLPITFTREMNYTAPRAGAGDLPFQIRNAAFELQQA